MNTEAIERRRSYSGPAILKQGFRPFFLGAAVWAALSLATWIAFLAGVIDLPSAFAPADWHAHELLFGYGMAAAAGFLLTAIPNWTGRLPISGWPLAGLFALWALGRATVFVSVFLPPLVTAAIDLAFPVLLSALIARELIAGKNTRNLRVLALVVIITAANLVFHIEAWSGGSAPFATRLGISALLMLILLIGGRIIPSFTRNWLARRQLSPLPVPFGRFDMVVLAVTGVSLLAWTIGSEEFWVAGVLILAGALNLVRMARWAGVHALAEPLVGVLHLGYGFIPLGFFAVAASIVFPAVLPFAPAVHLWTAGAVGMMTIAVMTRASLGHTGQELHAGWRITLIYLLLALGIVGRFAAGVTGDYGLVLHISAAGWIGAYLMFVIVYVPLFLKK